MKHIISLLLIFTLVNTTSFAQQNETDTMLQNEIKKLDFMIGDWEGSGWMMGADRTRHTFNQTEKIQYKVDGTTILVEGMGKSEGKVVHNAMAIISFKKEENHYNFRSYLANGRHGDFKAEIIEGKLYWYPAENIRYIIYLNEKGQWFEKGEMNRAENWYQFFEMTLDKKK